MGDGGQNSSKSFANSFKGIWRGLQRSDYGRGDALADPLQWGASPPHPPGYLTQYERGVSC
jgi:hypothetical protein